MNRLEKIPNGVYLALFAVLAVLFRSMTFHLSVIDHDESTYFVIARELLKGKLLYVDVWDTKPPGIFLIFAGIIGIFGDSIIAIRLVTSLVIALTAYFIFIASGRWGRDKTASLIGGLAYIIMTCTHKWNFAVNTEIYFNLLTALALFVFTGKKDTRHLFLVGLVFGLGFIIKYFVLFDFITFYIFYLFILHRERPARVMTSVFRNTLVMGVGFLLPFLAVTLFYIAAGNSREFFHVSFEVPLQYSEKFNLLKALNFIGGFHLAYAPVLILVYLLLWKGKDRSLALFGSAWLALVWIIIIIPGKFFFHYYFQLLVPLAFTLAGIRGSGLKVERFLARHSKMVLILFFTGFLAWNIGLQYNSFMAKPDVMRETADYLEPMVDEDDVIYCHATTVIYFLLDKSPPTRYIHTTLLSDPRHIRAIGLDAREEYRKLFAAHPEYVITQEKVPAIVQEYIDRSYELELTVRGKVRIFHRRPLSPGTDQVK